MQILSPKFRSFQHYVMQVLATLIAREEQLATWVYHGWASLCFNGTDQVRLTFKSADRGIAGLPDWS
jgi:hypothetical protein